MVSRSKLDEHFSRAARLFREEIRMRRKSLRRNVLLPAREFIRRPIPVAMITGTAGKTTTTRMLSHILKCAGFEVGMATSDEIIIGNEKIFKGTATGYWQHADVLNNKRISAAVLETARAGIRIHGTYINNPEVGALLNIGREQIDMDGIETVQDMLNLKRQVVDVARKAKVLNADDRLVRSLISEYPTSKVVLFSFSCNNEAVLDHISVGGTAFCLDECAEPKIVRFKNGEWNDVILIRNLPSACDGIARHNIGNAMAAAACAEGFGVSCAEIELALGSFENTPAQSAGRFIMVDGYPFPLLMDAATCPPAAEVVGQAVSRIAVKGVKRCMLRTEGNRPFWHYKEYAEILAPHFDYFVCYEIERYRKGRAAGEITALLREGLIAAGIANGAICSAPSYEAGLSLMAEATKSNDLIVILGSPEREQLDIMREAFSLHATANRRQNASIDTTIFQASA